MHSRTYEKLPISPYLYAASQLLSITDHQLPIQGACVVPLAGTPTEVLVTENLGQDVLLGDNVLSSAVIDMPGKILRLCDQKYPITTTTFRACPVMATSCFPKASNETLNQLRAYADVFSTKETPVGVATSVPEAEINIGSATPIKT